MSAVPAAPSFVWTAPNFAVPRQRRTAVRLARLFLLSFLLSLVFVPEYLQGTAEQASKRALYSNVLGGFRAIDLLILVLFLLHAFAMGCSRRRTGHFPRKLLLPLAGFAASILISLIYGAQRGGRNFFFDWRALALGAALYLVYRVWIQTEDDAWTAICLFAVIAAIRMATLFASYLAGGGDTVVGVRIPVFDGPSLSAFVCAALLGLACFTLDIQTSRRGAWLLVSGSAMLMVALSFRRSYWAELAIAVPLLVLITPQRRPRVLALPVCVAIVASLAMGPRLMDRIASFDVRQEYLSYGVDNADHVGDVLDAWDQVKASPWMGIGLGRSYTTWRIRNWKEESVMVHNAPLHIWLKYGVLGLASYLAFHLVLFGSLRRRAQRSPPRSRAIISGVLAYLAAQFIVSLGFTPWPYSAVQSTNLIAFLLAVAFVRGPSCHFQRSPLSPRPSTPQNLLTTQL